MTKFDKNYPRKICESLENPIISGQLDVDRIDYLLRDSHMTGSGYGKFDVEWLFNVLTVGIIGGVVKIGLDAGKGLSVAEDFVMARVHMFNNVYLHKTALVAENMLKLIVDRIRSLHDSDRLFPDLNAGLRRILLLKDDEAKPLSVFLADYLSVSDIDLYYFLKILSGSDDEILRRLSSGLLERRLTKQAENNKLDESGKIYHPGQEEIYLFDKSGVGFALSERSNIFMSASITDGREE